MTRRLNRKLCLLAALLSVLALVAAGCGNDDDNTASVGEIGAEGAPTGSPSASPSASATPMAPAPTEAPTAQPMDDEPMDPVSMDEEPESEPTESPAEMEMQALLDTFDANDDGTLTIGVAAAGPRDDQGYYQALVDFAEEFSAENGFAPPIVSDNIGAAEAAQAMSDLAAQGVDVILVGASEIAEPLADLTEQYPDIFWYCNCGAGFPETPGLAQATDWGSAIHYTAGVAMGAALQDRGGDTTVFLGCCDLGFEKTKIHPQ